jgi:hypothetical protein
MRFFNVYQYLALAVLFPLAYWLWWRRCDGSHRCTLLLLAMPVLYAYIIPGLGTNWLKLWEINTRLRLGRFRPHHGFVFGSATSLIALLCAEPRPADFGTWDVFRSGFVMGSVLAFWNWLYDIYAIKAGFITVYNRATRRTKAPRPSPPTTRRRCSALSASATASPSGWCRTACWSRGTGSSTAGCSSPATWPCWWCRWSSSSAFPI